MSRQWSFSVDVACLGCGAVLVHTEADPGDLFEVPSHECGA